MGRLLVSGHINAFGKLSSILMLVIWANTIDPSAWAFSNPRTGFRTGHPERSRQVRGVLDDRCWKKGRFKNFLYEEQVWAFYTIVNFNLLPLAFLLPAFLPCANFRTIALLSRSLSKMDARYCLVFAGLIQLGLLFCEAKCQHQKMRSRRLWLWIPCVLGFAGFGSSLGLFVALLAGRLAEAELWLLWLLFPLLLLTNVAEVSSSCMSRILSDCVTKSFPVCGGFLSRALVH